MFVEVRIQGETIPQVFPIPRKALRQENTVWIVNDENKLVIGDVDVVRRERETVLVQKGLKAGDRLILTALQGAANGMKIRPMEEGDEQ